MPAAPLLIGRAAEIQAVIAALAAAANDVGPNTILVTGPGGSGTSALTRRAARLVESRFPDGRLTLDTAAPPAQSNGTTPSGRTLLGRVLRQLGLGNRDLPQSPGGRAAAYRALLAGRRMLILVDNAIRADQFAPLAPSGSTSALLVASGRRLARVPNAIRLEIDPLTGTDGLALIAALAGSRRVAAESTSAAQLVALCSGLPLALRTVGMRLASLPQWPIRELAAAMSDPRRRLDLLDFDGLSVRASLARTSSGLATESLQVLQAMGKASPPGLTARALASRMGTPVTRVWQALEELTDVRLATSLRAGRYILANDLVRLYAQELGSG
jgi:hypothetical protein